MSQVPLEVNLPGPGILALAGSGEYLPGMREVDRWLIQRLNQPARVVTLATGAGTEGAERIQYWQSLSLDHFKGLGVEQVQAIPVIDRPSAEDKTLADAIRRANFVYLSGGKPGYLVQTLAGSPVWSAILEVLQTGGVVAACSAGAMIFGAQIPRIRPPWKLQPGFGLLPGTVILPHYDELPAILRQGLHGLFSGHTLIGVEGDTALVCTPQGCLVRGRGAVILNNGESFLQSTQGDEI